MGLALLTVKQIGGVCIVVIKKKKKKKMWTPFAENIKHSQFTVAADSGIVLMLLLVEFAANWHILPNYMPHNCIYCQRSRWQTTRMVWDTRPELEGEKTKCFLQNTCFMKVFTWLTLRCFYLVLFVAWKHEKMQMVVSIMKAVFTADLFAIHSQWNPLCRPNLTSSTTHPPHNPVCLHQSVRFGVNAV